MPATAGDGAGEEPAEVATPANQATTVGGDHPIQLAPGTESGERTFANYWQNRGRMTYFLTRHVGYRLGAILAVPLGRLGFSSNQVTLLALFVSILGTAATLSFVTGQVVQAICIFAVLILGYALDCADGMIARAHGQSSLFGAIFDKVSDLLAITICMALLAGAAFDDSPWSGIVTVSLFGTGMACRLALVLAVWLKEFVGSPPNRGVPDSRERTLDWHLRRAIGEATDHVFFIVLLAASWATGYFWEFFVIYHAALGIVMSGYLFRLYREIGRTTLGS